MPWRVKRTVSLASSPSPSRIRMVPSPYFEWRTRWPFLRLAAPAGAAISMVVRANEPDLPWPDLPPKKRAILSMEGASGPVGISASGVDLVLGSGALGLATIHEATKGLLDPGLGDALLEFAALLPDATEELDSWLSSS